MRPTCPLARPWRLSRFGVLAALAALAPARVSAQTTWIVDEGGGPGVHFTDLPPAVAAAGPNDTIVVFPGWYSPTTVTRGVRIVGAGAGTGGSRIHECDVRDLPSGEVLALGGFELFGRLQVVDCDGVVVVEDLVCAELSVEASHDVRIARCELRLGPNRILGSRVELVDCDVHAIWGLEIPCGPAGAGGLGLDVVASFVHLSHTMVRGGNGGYCNEQAIGCCGGASPAPGGVGLRAADSELVLTGSALPDGVHGGAGGKVWRIFQIEECPCGVSGPGLMATASQPGVASVRSSDVQYSGVPATRVGPDVAVVASDGDPVLWLSGPVVAGQPVLVRCHATPGERVRLEIGRSAVRLPDLPSPIEQLTSAERIVMLGNVPASGELQFHLYPPAIWPTGTLYFAQARVVDPATGAARRSNSTPFLVR